MLSNDQLYDLIHSTNDTEIKRIASSLEMALNDWPKLNLSEPEELINELNKVVSGKLTYDKLKKYLEQLNPSTDAIGWAWKSESLTSVLEMFDTKYPQKKEDLVSIINLLTGKIE